MSDVLVRLADGVLEITLNRVRKRNALTAEMYDVLAGQLEKASAVDDVRVIVFTAEGADFCAGNDLQEFLGSYDLRRGTPWRRFLDSLPAAAKPLVAAVQGNAVGIGMTMLLQFVVSFGFILPVNAPQNMVAYGTETFAAKDFVKTGLVLTAIGYALVLLLGATYWSWMGYLVK